MSCNFSLPVPTPYDFAASVNDHGWVALAPCGWNVDTQELERVERLHSGRVVLCRIGEEESAGQPCLQVRVECEGALSMQEQQELSDKISWMLKLGEDLAEFYAHAEAGHDGVWQTVRGGRGRLLRSPTLWEDVVKTICTTNITWSQTKSMAARLVEALGTPYPGDPALHTFPTPAQVLEAGEEFFSKNVRMGYRNGYVLQLAAEVAGGQRDLEALRSASLSLAEMKKELLRIKGIGAYAAHTLLAILGYYGEIAVDTEYRNFVMNAHYGGKETPDKVLAKFYDSWGDWQYLAYWFDATYRHEQVAHQG